MLAGYKEEQERKGRKKEKPKRNKKIQRGIRGFRPFTRLTVRFFDFSLISTFPMPLFPFSMLEERDQKVISRAGRNSRGEKLKFLDFDF